jgi:Mono-functional DNA-alkylating methyl methanesulfonate N-term
MEFLLSSTAKSKAVLALLVSKKEATYVFLYSWIEKAPLRTVKLENCGPHKLSDKDRMPLLMIPSNHNASFTLVTEFGVTVYEDVLSSNCRQICLPLPQKFPSKFVGSNRSPLWVQWAKPCRHSEYLKTNDDFYLVREDGRLEYFEITHNTPTKVLNGGEIGSINIAVDTAFAILEAPLEQGGDLCVVGGDMTDGAVCHMMARKPLDRFQTITNLAPLTDMLIMDTKTRGEDSDRIFMCSGRGEGHAALAEIRHGLEARISSILEQEDSSVATGLWVLPETIWNHLTILVSYPLQTLALRINLEKTLLETIDDEFADHGLQLRSQTLALAVLHQGLLVQITSSATTIMSPLSKLNSIQVKHANCPVLIASISTDDMLIVTVTMVDDVFRVLLSSINVDDETICINVHSTAYSMEEEPSSILIANAANVQLLIVGTITGSVHVLEIEPDHGIRLLSRHSITTLFPHVESSAICSLVLLGDSALGLPALTCGTRNGWLLGMIVACSLPKVRPRGRESPNVLQTEQNDLLHAITLRPDCAQHIGQTSVRLSPDSEDPSAAMLFCDFQVHQLSYLQSDWAASFKVLRAWFTDVAQVCPYKPLTDFAQC